MLEYMLKNGTEKFAEEARDKSYLLRMLQNFNWSEEGRDKGAGSKKPTSPSLFPSTPLPVLVDSFSLSPSQVTRSWGLLRDQQQRERQQHHRRYGVCAACSPGKGRAMQHSSV